MDYALILASCILAVLGYQALQWLRKSQHNIDFARRHGCQPVRKHLTNPRWPPLGLDKLFPMLKADQAGRLPAFMLEEFERHGNTYSQTVNGQYVIITRSPENVEAVCKTNFKDYEIGADRIGNFSALIKDGILAQDGKSWATSRTMLRPHFVRNAELDFQSLESHFQSLFARLVRFESEPVDMTDCFNRLAFDFASEAIFGASTNYLSQNTGNTQVRSSTNDEDSPSSESFVEAANHAVSTMGDRGRLLDFYWLVDSPRFRRSCRTCKRFIDKYLHQARNVKDGNIVETELRSDSFLASIVNKENIPPLVIRDQLLSLFLASRDTTATFLSWVIYALARNPRVLQKLCETISSSFPNPQPLPQPNDVSNLPYLRHVLNETLRLYSVVPINGRKSLVDTILPSGGGKEGTAPIAVPAGTLVAFNIFCMHRRKDIFGEDANDFRPERWEEDIAGPNHDFGEAFVPFISGPRVCLGKNLAMLTVSYIIIRFLQHFDRFELQENPNSKGKRRRKADWPSEATRYGLEDNETTFSLRVTMAPRDGVWVKLHKAEKI